MQHASTCNKSSVCTLQRLEPTFVVVPAKVTRIDQATRQEKSNETERDEQA